MRLLTLQARMKSGCEWVKAGHAPGDVYLQRGHICKADKHLHLAIKWGAGSPNLACGEHLYAEVQGAASHHNQMQLCSW